jgi:tryptophan-rich sensory protein
MANGPVSEWYVNLNKAPWTPPGWVFGAAWTVIMLCFSWYLSVLFSHKANKLLVVLYAIQVVLNVSWNWIFFNQHWVLAGLISITFLTLLIGFFFFKFDRKDLRKTRLLLIPYMVWLCIATSLNAYVVLYN